MNYIVYLVDKESQTPFDLRTTRRGDPEVRVHGRYSQEKTTIDGDTIELGTFLCRSMKEAETVAQWVLERRPKLDVYIAQTTNIISAKAVETVTKQVTEKGVLPA